MEDAHKHKTATRKRITAMSGPHGCTRVTETCACGETRVTDTYTDGEILTMDWFRPLTPMIFTT